MRAIVVGMGVQGHKRRQFAGADFVAAVDPVSPDADYAAVSDVPLGDFDIALVCVPDEPKDALLEYLLGNGKHVLVEKPLWTPRPERIDELQAIARRQGVVCYTAYNHRFEPHFVRMRELIDSGRLGEIYSVRMFYGNGTARLVRDSEWRDTGAGVLPDLGSHLLDTLVYWLGPWRGRFTLSGCHRFENSAPDHVVLASEDSRPRVELEMTLLSWRNHFTCDVLAAEGSAHVASLCKWGPSTFTHNSRVLPAGRPPEESVVLTRPDPTWELEYAHFKRLCESGAETDLAHDRWLLDTLESLAGSTRPADGAAA